MDWIGSKVKKLTDNLKLQLGNPPCVNCQKPAVMMFDNSGYVVCNDQRCYMAVFQVYQNDLSEFIVVLSAMRISVSTSVSISEEYSACACRLTHIIFSGAGGEH